MWTKVTFKSGSALSRISVVLLGGLLVLGAIPRLVRSSETPVPSRIKGWQRLQSFFNQENTPPGGGHRGSRPVGSFCMISPQADHVLWHRTPLLVWQGYPTVGIRPEADEVDVLWQATASDELVGVDAGVFQAAYSGAPLVFETIYEGLLYTIDPNSPALKFPFQIMDEAQHAFHAAELTLLEQELGSANADPEALALAKATYFIEHELPSDALQVLFSVQEPSAGFAERRLSLTDAICAAPDEVRE